MPRTRGNNNLPLVNGFLNLYKPAGITSMEALRQVKRITGQRQKVGHAGTMDPLARGVLPVCFGQATRLMDYLVEGAKRYLVEVTLGITTATYDAEGEVVEQREVGQITRNMVEAILRQFTGSIQQTPPMYSAVKVQGKRLYQLARAGVEVERKARPVEIYNILLLDFSSPTFRIEVECGRGVYMRSLAHDLGQALGCGGYVSSLERVQVGGFLSKDGVTLDVLAQAYTSDTTGWQQYLYPVDWALKNLKSLAVGKFAEEYLLHGQSVNLGSTAMTPGYLEQFRVYSGDGRFLALVRYNPTDNNWQPIKVFHSNVPSPYAPVSPQS